MDVARVQADLAIHEAEIEWVKARVRVLKQELKLINMDPERAPAGSAECEVLLAHYAHVRRDQGELASILRGTLDQVEEERGK